MKAFNNGVVNGAIVGAAGAATVKACQAYNWVALKLPNSAITFNEHATQATSVLAALVLATLAVSSNRTRKHSTAGVFTGVALALGLTAASVFVANPNSETKVTPTPPPAVQLN